MRLKIASRAAPLAALSATEMLVPFVRMFILTHLLGPYEFGFAAALSAAYATVEQITDTGIFRFVLSSPRERYKTALATAHGIALVRGLLVGTIFVAVAYPTSCTMVTCDNWTSFVWLAPLTMIKSFENLELKVFERDYRYGPQLLTSIASHSCGLSAMLIIGFETNNHEALLGYMIVQALVFVAFTHLLAKTRFNAMLRGPMTRDALHFSLPLMANGAGLALLGQGDRLFVGAALGLETLGLYAVMILTAYVPTAALFRLIGPLQFAGLVNSASDRGLYIARLKLYSRTIPMIAAVYSVGWIVLGRSFIPAVFGSRFVVSEVEVLLVGMIVFFRICRTEPATCLLIQTHNTRRLALVNQLPIVGLALAAFLVWIHPTLEFLLMGTSMGELVSLVAMLFGARKVWGGAWRDAVVWCGGMAVVPAAVGSCFVLPDQNADAHLVMRVAIGASCAFLISIVAWFALTGLVRRGYGKGAAAHPTTPADGTAASSPPGFVAEP